jgi:hypothetical protein
MLLTFLGPGSSKHVAVDLRRGCRRGIVYLHLDLIMQGRLNVARL